MGLQLTLRRNNNKLITNRLTTNNYNFIYTVSTFFVLLDTDGLATCSTTGLSFYDNHTLKTLLNITAN